MELDTGKINVVLFYCQLRTGHFGAGTHINQLLPFLKQQADMQVTVIKTDCLQLREVEHTTEENIEIISIPQPENKFYLHSEDTDLQRTYATRLMHIIYPFLYRKGKLVCWVNSIDYLNIAYALKETFPDAGILYVHHAWSWKCYSNVPDEVFSAKLAAGEKTFHPLAFEMNGYQQALAGLADHVITVTDQAKRFFEEALSIEGSNISCIYNGIPVPDVNLQHSTLLREKYGFKQEDKLILYTGRIKKEKGLHVLINAFKAVCRKHPEAKLILAGYGDFAAFIPLVSPHWTQIIFTGELGPEQMNELYTIADMGVLPSLFEQCSFTAIEMRFFRLPMIVSSVDGLDEMFEDNVDALKLTVHLDGQTGEKCLSVQELAEKIMLLLNDSGLSDRLAKAAYEKATQYFTASKMQEEYARVFRLLAERTSHLLPLEGVTEQS